MLRRLHRLSQLFVDFPDSSGKILQLCDRLPSPMGESGVDCAKVSSMPSVSFSIGGKVFPLPAEQVCFSLIL